MSEFSEVSVIGSINVTLSGCIEVRRDTVILRDGVQAAPATHHRHVLAPGDDLEDQDPRVQAVANAVWTADVIGAYAASQAAVEASRPTITLL